MNEINPTTQHNAWTNKQIIVQNAIMSAFAVPVSTVCYEFNCGAKPQPRKNPDKNITNKRTLH